MQSKKKFQLRSVFYSQLCALYGILVVPSVDGTCWRENLLNPFPLSERVNNEVFLN